MELGKLFFPRKSQIRDIASGARFAANKFTEIVGDDEVEARFLLVGGSILRIDAVEEFNQFENANFEPGFLSQFTPDGFFDGFANLDGHAGDGPFAKQRLRAAAN